MQFLCKFSPSSALTDLWDSHDMTGSVQRIWNNLHTSGKIIFLHCVTVVAAVSGTYFARVNKITFATL